MLTAITIFVATYAFLAIGEIPGLRIDRTGAALIGAGLMIAFGVVSLPEAYRAVDFDTILLLLSMMILVAYMRLSGLFQLVSRWVAEHVRTQIASYKTPRSIEFRTEALPKSGAGKILKRDLREKYWVGKSRRVN